MFAFVLDVVSCEERSDDIVLIASSIEEFGRRCCSPTETSRRNGVTKILRFFLQFFQFQHRQMESLYHLIVFFSL